MGKAPGAQKGEHRKEVSTAVELWLPRSVCVRVTLSIRSLGFQPLGMPTA